MLFASYSALPQDSVAQLIDYATCWEICSMHSSGVNNLPLLALVKTVFLLCKQEKLKSLCMATAVQ